MLDNFVTFAIQIQIFSKWPLKPNRFRLINKTDTLVKSI